MQLWPFANKPPPSTFYLIGEASFAFLTYMAMVVLPVYYVLTVHMNPLQLVLVGTAFELTIFLFQVPTGLVADIYSRRLSVLVGWFLAGCALILQGFVPLFAPILLAQLLDGLGDAFVSGAWPAWLVDEVGEERFGAVLTRGLQLRQVGAFAGTILGALLATIHLQLPIVLAGVLFFVLCIFGLAAMAEQRASPKVHPSGLKQLSRWNELAAALGRSVRLVQASRLMLAILAIAAIFGAFSEAIDRLGEAHFLLDIRLPPLAVLKPVAWFGVIGAGGLLLGAAAIELPRRRVNLQSHHSVTRALFFANGAIILSVLAFALVPDFVLALCAYWAWRVLQPVVDLLSTVWLNQNIPDSEVRATVLSMSGQANALGEWVGGPVIGLIGTVLSIRAALSAGALLLSPALALYAWALRRPVGAEVGEAFARDVDHPG